MHPQMNAKFQLQEKTIVQQYLRLIIFRNVLIKDLDVLIILMQFVSFAL